ncbi:hypothetical protein [Aciditerrimonas ferrireducens]|jgi:hypothetical protein|uniref:hypothetical protein n=1 Tax=Aciditerrimonas ferrireducens TaxID=667306 RepID=UPI002006B2D6|nr:hypothetical protein [Aciditerrimonas ferrireducens]MCK4175941.1 hypothetical protein [Aciditerrimonas ferrireducens]
MDAGRLTVLPRVPVEADGPSRLTRLLLGPYGRADLGPSTRVAVEAALWEAIDPVLAGRSATWRHPGGSGSGPALQGDASWLAGGASGGRQGSPGGRGLRQPIAREALAALVEGTWASPLEAVRVVAARAAAQAGEDPEGSPWWAGWLRRAAPGEAAAALAAATTWTSTLWEGIRWDELAGRVRVVTRGQRWRGQGPVSLTLRARADLRVQGEGGVGLLVAQPGAAPEAWATRLGAPALVAALAGEPGDVPAWVVGWWPEAGQLRVVTVDEAQLVACARAVGQGVARLLTETDRATSGHRRVGRGARGGAPGC